LRNTVPNPHACPSMSPVEVHVHDRDRAAYCRWLMAWHQPPARQTANELLPSAHLVAATQLFYSSRRYVVSPCPVVHFRPRYKRSTDDAQNYQTCHESIHDADLATRSKHRPCCHCLYTTRVSPHSALLVHHPPFVSFPLREQSVDQHVALTHYSGWRCRCHSGSPSQPIA